MGQTPTFAPAVNYDTGINSGPINVLAADVTGDGKLDLLTANHYSNSVAVQRGTGLGSFQGFVIYSTGTGSFPHSLAVADVNGDGQPDLLTANWLSNTVGVLLGTGAGGFGTVSAYSTGANSQPNSLVVTDVNGDGQLDVLTSNAGSSTVGVLLGTGTGGFGAVSAYSTGMQSGPLSLAVADVNGDGRLDLLTANNSTNAVGVLLGTATGGFGTVTAYNAGPNSSPFDLTVADVNGDGQPDVLTANSLSNTVGVLLGTGTGSFGTVTTYSTGAGSQPHRLAVADVNGDGKLDVVTANTSDATAGILLGTGTGSFGTPLTYSAGPACYPQGIAVADVNGDGKPDLLTANTGSNTAGVLLNNSVLPTRATLPGTRVSLYPNPADRTATLSGAPAGATVQVLDGLGRVVLTARADEAGTARLASLAPGLYVVRADGASSRLVVE